MLTACLLSACFIGSAKAQEKQPRTVSVQFGCLRYARQEVPWSNLVAVALEDPAKAIDFLLAHGIAGVPDLEQEVSDGFVHGIDLTGGRGPMYRG